MYGRPPTCAVVDSYGEDTKEKEEAGHAKAHLVDRRVANQSFAVLPCIQLLTHLTVERDLIDKITSPKIPQSDHYEKNKHHCSCLSSTWPQRKEPNSIYSERHASKGAERENRQQQQPLFLSMKPSFITRSLQAVRGALQLTVSVPKQKTQMNKLTAFCQQVRGIGKSEKQREHE